jgi:hypothetical protein
MTTGGEKMALLRRWIETYERDGFEAALALVDEIFAADHRATAYGSHPDALEAARQAQSA